MAAKKLTDTIVKTYVEMLAVHGEEGMYRKIIGYGIIRYASNIKAPELELLDLAEAFFASHRRGEDEILFTIGKILRRAAHTLHRRLKKEEAKAQNNRFIVAIK